MVESQKPNVDDFILDLPFGESATIARRTISNFRTCRHESRHFLVTFRAVRWARVERGRRFYRHTLRQKKFTRCLANG